MLKRLKRWLSDEHPEQVIIDMRPERPRHWHNPSDPVQAARIKAAREKRTARKVKRAFNAEQAFLHNRAHFAWSVGSTLDPFHVVRS